MSIAKIAVNLVLIAVLVGGVAFSMFFSVNESTWDTSTILIWGFIAVVGTLGCVIVLLKEFGVKIEF